MRRIVTDLRADSYGLNRRARLAVQSNGALTGYNWACRHPDSVDRILGIFPVMDLSDWPEFETLADLGVGLKTDLGYGLSKRELARRINEFNPIDNLAPLADARVPIMHVHGDQDPLVSFHISAILAPRRYRALGGKMDIHVVPGGKHDGGPGFYDVPRANAFLLADNVGMPP